MIPSLSSLTDKALIGNDAGYLLAFYAEKGGKIEPKPGLEVGRDEYYSEIQASLPSGLAGGTYSFVIEGMTDDDYGKIAQEKLPIIKLFLYWRDTNTSALGYLKNVAGLTDMLGSKVKADELKDFLVAVLRVVKVSRRTGARRYEAVIEARELVFDRIDKKRVSPPLSFPSPLEAAKSKAEAQKVEVQTYPIKPGPNQAQENAGTDQQQFEEGRPLLETLNRMGGLMEQFSGKHGRGMYLIRNGKLHIGERKFPLEGDIKSLTLAGGLIETEALAPVLTDPNFDESKKPDEKPPQRRQFKLILKGRPDIKPGDVVKFDSPELEVAKTKGGGLLGAIGDLVTGSLLPNLGGDFKNPVNLYVNSVEHKLGRKSGFVTTVTGVEIKDANDAWDKHTEKNAKATGSKAAPTSAEDRAAQAVQKRVEASADAKRFPEVGEVRRMTTTGKAEPPSQTLDLFCGLAPGDGRNNQGRRLAVERPSPMPIIAAAYTSPFAWGKCGLVLPRYPGTRVLVAYRNGSSDDAIEVGALWESGHGPDSKAGDWWLILPVGVPANERATIGEKATPKEHTGKVSQDLIDADGNRVIEVGELTIRVGRDKLKNAGERPARGANDSITIEHSGGQASIVIDQNGKVSIKANNIDLDAGSGDISMKAANVKVTVSGTMDVSG